MLSTGQVNRAFGVVGDFAEAGRRVSSDMARYSMAPRLLEGGTDIGVVQALRADAGMARSPVCTTVETRTTPDVTSLRNLRVRREAMCFQGKRA